MKALQIQNFGNPVEVLRVVDVPDVGDPGVGEVVIAVESAPLNQYDKLLISGGYGYTPTLPAIMGTEGAGVVVAVGKGVDHLKEGDRTIVPFLKPSWVQQTKVASPWLRPLPAGDINQFAMLGVNPPTAYLLLTDKTDIAPGSWIIQNGANSGVGRAIIPIAKSLGIRTVNVVRRQELIAELEALGGDIVILDGPDLGKRVAEVTNNAQIHYAFDCLGGSSTFNLMSCLTDAGVLTVYGGTSRQPMAAHPGHFIFKQNTIRGFWLYFWYGSAKADEIVKMFSHLAPMVADGRIATPVSASYRLDDFKAALDAAAISGGKVMFQPNS